MVEPAKHGEGARFSPFLTQLGLFSDCCSTLLPLLLLLLRLPMLLLSCAAAAGSPARLSTISRSSPSSASLSLLLLLGSSSCCSSSSANAVGSSLQAIRTDPLFEHQWGVPKVIKLSVIISVSYTHQQKIAGFTRGFNKQGPTSLQAPTVAEHA